MPHQCTDCNRQFDDGSKEMLSGCPECGGNKFQFLPSSEAEPAEQSSSESTPAQPEQGSERSVARTVGNAATAVRDLVGSSSDSSQDVGAPGGPSTDTTPRTGSQPQEPTAQRESTRPESPSQRESTTDRQSGPSHDSRQTPEPAAASMAQTENDAQASARSEVISPDELPSTADRTEQRWPGEFSSQPAPASEESSTDETQSDRPDLSELRAELNEQFESIKVLNPGQYELNLMELFDREEYIVALQEDGKYTVQVPERWQE